MCHADGLTLLLRCNGGEDASVVLYNAPLNGGGLGDRSSKTDPITAPLGEGLRPQHDIHDPGLQQSAFHPYKHAFRIKLTNGAPQKLRGGDYRRSTLNALSFSRCDDMDLANFGASIFLVFEEKQYRKTT